MSRWQWVTNETRGTSRTKEPAVIVLLVGQKIFASTGTAGTEKPAGARRTTGTSDTRNTTATMMPRVVFVVLVLHVVVQIVVTVETLVMPM